MGADSHLKGVLLTGGHGTRLRPFTYTGAKQLIPIANKPVVFYAIESMVAAGVTDIAIVTGDTAKEVFAALGDGAQFDARFTYVHQGAPRGISHAVLTAREFLKDSPFVLFLGDNFLRGGIHEHAEVFRSSGADAQLLLTPVENPRAFGIAVLDSEGRLVRLVEKPAEPPGNLAVTGIYFFGSRFLEAASEIQPSARGELEITDAIQRLLDTGGDVRATHLSEDWIDTGSPQDLVEANRLILRDLVSSTRAGIVRDSQLHGSVVLEDSSEVIDSTIEGPAIIGRGTRVLRSKLGPNVSIYHNCSITDSRIADSIVLERTTIESSGPLGGSLIGRDVTLRGLLAGRPMRVMLGDQSRMEAP